MRFGDYNEVEKNLDKHEIKQIKAELQMQKSEIEYKISLEMKKSVKINFWLCLNQCFI